MLDLKRMLSGRLWRHVPAWAGVVALSFPAAACQAADMPRHEPSTLEQKIREVRYDLQITDGRLAGSAAPILEDAIAGARYVLIGEDHLTREIPALTSVVCDLMAPDGLSAMALETSHEAANFVAASMAVPGGSARISGLLQKYPMSVAFLDSRQESDMVAHCAGAARASALQLFGLDQEFLGAAGWLLDLIQATHPGPLARAAVARLQDEERQSAAKARETGDFGQLFIFSASEASLSAAAVALQSQGSARARALFGELLESRRIYLESARGLPAANSDRAELLKRNLKRDLESVKGTSRPGRVLVKFGDWHLYKGFNPLHQRDLGNYIAEFADGQASTSLHVCVLGARGTHRLLKSYGNTQLEAFVLDQDEHYRWLKPMIDLQVDNAWTLYDLRKLRFQRFDEIDPDLERLIDGYDLLIIVPEITPADLLG